jgi:CheY-like chemotaxis protein
MSDEQQRYLFDRFTQVDNSITREYGGTGLGLAICSQLVNIMSGEIRVSSSLGSGSTFEIILELPLASDNGMLAEALTLTKSDRLNVLYIRQVSSRAEILEKCLDEYRISYTAALNCQELPVDHTFNVLIVDTSISGALDVVEHLSDQQCTAFSTTFFISPYNQQTEAKEALSGYFQHFFYHPISYRNLLLAMDAIDLLDNEKTPHDKLCIEDYTMRYQGGRVLLVDDNSLNLGVAQRVLNSLGIDSVVASNGKEAIQILKEQSLNAVFMDCQMPIMDGYQATKLIRSGQSGALNSQIPIIAMTAHALTGDKEKCLQAGMDDYLSKPVTKDNWITILDKWLVGRILETTSLDPLSVNEEESTSSDSTRLSSEG